MKRILAAVILVLGMTIGLAMPASAGAKERDAAGGGAFTLNPTCDPNGGEFACEFDAEALTLNVTLSNPGITTGTFKGTQLFTADFLVNVIDNTFEMTGIVVWNGRVKACGVGTVVYDVFGSGYLEADGTAFFEVNHQTINPIGTTLPIDGFLDLPGLAPTDPETGIGELAYTGQYTCDHSHAG